jgi:large subunit ribosomal protein L6
MVLLKKPYQTFFFFERGYYLTLYFFLKKNRLERDSVLTQTTLLSNAFIGLSRKYRIDLWVKGVGFKLRVFTEKFTTKKNIVLKLSLGQSHLLKFEIPKGCTAALIGKKKLFFSGICFQELTQLVAFIQKFKSPDPYKGKGLNYRYKVKVLKQGKKK